MTSQLPRLRCLFLSYQMQKTPKTGQSLRPFLIRDNFSALFVLLCLSLNVNSRNRNISFGHVRSSNKFYLSFNPVGENFRTQLKPIYIHSVVLVSYLAKLTRVKRVVSKSCATIKGPSTRINGILERKYNNKKLCIKQAADIVRQMNAIGHCTLLHYGQRGV